jgi:hypothetical protein
VSEDGQDTFGAWYTRQEMADLLKRDVRTITRMVDRGEVEKDDSDPLHPRFRYKGRVTAAKKAKTDRTDSQRESVRLLLETIQSHAERIAALEAENHAIKEEIAALRGAQPAAELSAGQDGRDENVRPPRPAWWRRIFSPK